MRQALIITAVLLAVTLGLLWQTKKTSEIITTEVEAEIKNANESAGWLKIIFLDVGQGDAGFIEFSNGEQMLVDCAVDARILEALGRVMPYYDRTIDYLLVTHPDSDHYGGCIDVLDRFKVKHIIYNGLEKFGDKYWEEFWRRVQQEGAEYIKIDKLDVWEVGGAVLTFYYPNHDVAVDAKIPDSDKTPNDNNTSVVFKLNYLDGEILFTGDMEAELEEYLLKIFGDKLDVDILKVGHHGSAGASSQEFLDVVTPEYAAISSGKNNKYGHPSLRVLKRLERAGAMILRTDLQGDIVCEVGERISCQ